MIAHGLSLYPTRYLLALPLLAVCLAFVAGIATATGFDSSTVELVALAVVAAASSPLTWRRERIAFALATLIPLAFVAGLSRADDGLPSLGSVAAISSERVEITGVIVTDIERHGAEQRFRLNVERLKAGTEQIETDGTVFIRAPLGPALAYGDQLHLTTTLHPSSTISQGQRDFWSERGIGAIGIASSVTVLAHAQGDPRPAALTEARLDIDHALAHALDEPLAGLAQGIATGQRTTLEPELRADLNDTSLSHLVVISGSNVTILAMLLVAAIAWATGRRRAVLIAIAFLSPLLWSVPTLRSSGRMLRLSEPQSWPRFS